MKNGSGARRATPLIPIAAKRGVAIAKMITPVQKMEQNRAAIKDAKKNHFMSMSAIEILRQQCDSPGPATSAPAPFLANAFAVRNLTDRIAKDRRREEVPVQRARKSGTMTYATRKPCSAAYRHPYCWTSRYSSPGYPGESGFIWWTDGYISLLRSQLVVLCACSGTVSRAWVRPPGRSLPPQFLWICCYSGMSYESHEKWH
jgi:hypothetical protein